MEHQPLAAEPLLRFTTRVFQAVGVPAEDARLVADTLVRADLRGHQSHGVMRTPWYVGRIRSGVMRPVTDPHLVTDAGAIAVIDGQDGVGQVLAARAAREAIARARQHGVGVVAVRNSNHFGAAAYYTLMAPPEGCIALLTTNASPAMAPWGGRKAVVGNNPWSVAAPAGKRPPVVLDIANTVVARGKIYLARQAGRPIPLGWAIDQEGRPTTDPASALAGLILPMGEHKGYAISFMLDVLSGVLTGSGFGASVAGPYQAERRSGCGHLLICLNIGSFMPVPDFEQRMGALIAQIKSVLPAPGFTEVFYPGELEARNEQRQLQEGLVLPEQTLTDLRTLATELNLPFPG